MIELKEIDIQKLSLGEGDILVVHIPPTMKITDEDFGRIAQGFQAIVNDAGYNNRVVVLTDGMSLEVVEKK